jgi:hypothetical protein
MSEGMSEERMSSWYDDAPITDEQIETVRRDLTTPPAERGAAFAPFVVRKLLGEIDRLNTVLDANRVVRNAAESSSRVYKAVVDRLKVERTRLRADRDQLRARLDEIGETREEWGYGDAPERVSVPLAQGYRNGTPRQWAEEAARRSSLKVWMRVAGEWREVPDA